MDLSDWHNAIRWGLAGLSSHIEPRRAIQGLTAEAAAQAPPGGLHSAHRILHHLVYWQDLMLAPVAGDKADWPSTPEDWDAEMPPWDQLVGQFEAGLTRAERLAAEADLTAPIPAWGPEMTAGGALVVLVTHNSYHLGQLVDSRKATGHWPPPAAQSSG